MRTARSAPPKLFPLCCILDDTGQTTHTHSFYQFLVRLEQGEPHTRRLIPGHVRSCNKTYMEIIILGNYTEDCPALDWTRDLAGNPSLFLFCLSASHHSRIASGRRTSRMSSQVKAFRVKSVRSKIKDPVTRLQIVVTHARTQRMTEQCWCLL